METLQDCDVVQSLFLFTIYVHRELFLNISAEFDKEGKLISVGYQTFRGV